MYTVPIFLVTGYLDSGKSTFIKDTIANGAFDGKTLLLVAEQGEIEYDSDNLDRLNVHIEYFNSLEEFSSDAIQKLIKKYRPDQMFIEVNGMWDLNNVKFPPAAQILQTIYMIDGSTFPQYFANMTQSIIDSVKKASVVIFTKVSDPNRQVEPFKNSLKMA
ncbi:MAG: GTPase, partial [Gammaproteobacteria bacterium]|nr:GTPase [Gammaproteobacteria bacterium]